ncbi:non-processive endocellulase [Pseudarcicella hirudinis]|uniref:Endoglucanase n=1 Tax=Pseudarcicella hirudinis TaxID=1079859 RepID=A0A1I5XY50_9BACT|nr:glycoside hydrolase family 9 protein [Pseudarcicella hirudinis]SFQ36810.1 non-processive endocellulase [Pseudarcicella hirudinis]
MKLNTVKLSVRLALMILWLADTTLQAQSTAADGIKINQIGFYPKAPKIAVITAETPQDKFYLLTSNSKDTVFTGKLGTKRVNSISQKTTRIADFSGFQQTGEYVVSVPGSGNSYAFSIQPEVHRAAAIGALKGYYYQRASTALPQKYAGKWTRAAGHPDDKVLIHSSAASEKRPAGSVISSQRGWYDAGDYNKYIVNSGITMGTLLSVYEEFPGYFEHFETNIPESNNNIPDILDETLWNLRWMFTMQDPEDGGVYHKLTNPSFDKMIMPADCHNPRYVVQKNTIASLDFAAVMAQAGRVFKAFPKAFPGLSDSCMKAAESAWLWAKKNPSVYYRQNENNTHFDPKISTGAYEDKDNSDEWIWAATELYLSTGNESYLKNQTIFPENTLKIPTWSQVQALAYYSLLRNEKNLGDFGRKLLPEARKRVLELADNLLENAENTAYYAVMGKSENDYMWGSNAHAANEGIVLIQAYKLTNDRKYLDFALGNLDFILGRNATGYCFLTGFGKKPTMNPHHRPSMADHIREPVPGLLSGGTNAKGNKQDKCFYPINIPDEMYSDNDCSFASNEIAINWNAPFVYLISAMEILQK